MAHPDPLRLRAHGATPPGRNRLRAIGRKAAHDLALTLVSVYQGASLLANTFHGPAVLQAQARWLHRFIDSVD